MYSTNCTVIHDFTISFFQSPNEPPPPYPGYNMGGPPHGHGQRGQKGRGRSMELAKI